MKTISTTVNGKQIAREVADNRLLIEFLRDDLKMTGTKEGCSAGVCGACTVMVNGEPVSSCLTLAVLVDRGEITTIEGIADNGALHPVQQAFIDCGGFQCGICTPGQIMAAVALLRRNKNPTRAEIQHWMMGNLCRCTGYYKIIDSIERAIELSR
jgi:carbon-monoxide dehydrogenase small subunit